MKDDNMEEAPERLLWPRREDQGDPFRVVPGGDGRGRGVGFQLSQFEGLTHDLRVLQ